MLGGPRPRPRPVRAGQQRRRRFRRRPAPRASAGTTVDGRAARRPERLKGDAAARRGAIGPARSAPSPAMPRRRGRRSSSTRCSARGSRATSTARRAPRSSASTPPAGRSSPSTCPPASTATPARCAAPRSGRRATVTFARRKPGHLLLPGRAHCGPVAVADIGIADEIIAAVGGRTFANGPALWRRRFPRPRLDAHKYQRGHALVALGRRRPDRRGAARRARRAAGRGRPRHASPRPPEALGDQRRALTAVMVRAATGRRSSPRILADPRFNAVVLGPALGVDAMTRDDGRRPRSRRGAASCSTPTR